MKVTILSNSDSSGGAAVVTTRLMLALRRLGVDARMIVNSKFTTNAEVELGGTRSGRSFAFMKERLEILMNNGMSRKNLFTVSTASAGTDPLDHPWIKEADIILLSWINQGLLSLDGIERLGKTGKPIVWMMHDMWCMTGICHHAGECRGYTHACGCCPLLNSTRPGDLSHRVWDRKSDLYHDVPISFVAVSNWLAEKCRESTLLRDQSVTVIPNAVPVDSFSIEPQNEIHFSQIDYSKDIILMGAARLDDPIKGLDYTIDALNRLFMERPALAQKTVAVFFGNVRDRSVFDRLNFPFRYVGHIHDQKVLRELYAAARVVVSTSLYETLPGTLIEGQASGCLPVTFDHGGQRDIVEHLKNGYIADYKDARSVARGIEWALTTDFDPTEIREGVRRRFSSKVVAEKYIDLFNKLLKNG